MRKEEQVIQGVADAWDFWLSQRDVSVPELVNYAITKTINSWLDTHEGEILDTISLTFQNWLNIHEDQILDTIARPGGVA